MARAELDQELDELLDDEILAELRDPIPFHDAAVIVYMPVLLVGAVLAVFWQDTIPDRLWGPDPLGDLVVGLGVATGLVALTRVLARFLRPFQELDREFRRVLGPLTLPQVASLAVVSGLSEEVLFRGVIQPWIGWIAASVIFGLLHFVPSLVFAPWTAFALLAGFIFGWLFEERQSLLTPVVAHIAINMVNLRLITRPQASAEGQDVGARAEKGSPVLPSHDS